MRPRAGAVALAVAFVACAAAAAAPAAGPAGIEPTLTKALTAPSLSLGRTAALAVDLSTDTIVFAHNESLPVAPASNEKIPVSWAALTRLGVGYRFHTEVYGVGTRAGTTWNGDLVLKGFGDPTLSTSDLDRLAATISGRGIRSVSGRILGDESFYDAKRGAAGWKRYFVGGRDASAVGARRRPGPGLAGALAAAPRGSRLPGCAHPPRRRGQRQAGPRPRARRCRSRSPPTSPILWPRSSGE